LDFTDGKAMMRDASWFKKGELCWIMTILFV